MLYDVFISHATGDKSEVALPLARTLTEYGLRVCVDSTFSLGDGLRQRIDQGLSQSRFALVILSPEFFAKEWTRRELDALVSREGLSDKVILPIRHGMTVEEVGQFSPLLGGRVSISTAQGLDFVAQQVLGVVREGTSPARFRSTRPVVVGISGASCSGKTWLAQKFQSLRPDSVSLFDLDGFYREEDVVRSIEHRHDNPLAINFEDALIALSRLIDGKEVQVPAYSFSSHSRDGYRTCKPAPIIVVEGIFVLANETLRKELDVKVWIEASGDRRFERRLARDTIERSRDYREVIERYAQDVTPGYEKFVRPLRGHADIVFQNNGRNREMKPILLNMLLAYAERLNYARQ